MPVVGCLHAASADAQEANVAALRKGLSETGFVEGRNLAIAFRYADNDYNRLPALVTELARRRVAVIVAFGGGLVTRAVKSVTANIPIVFVQGDDPVTMVADADLPIRFPAIWNSILPPATIGVFIEGRGPCAY
jgi:putative ABC transport system substrate-binding protein